MLKGLWEDRFTRYLVLALVVLSAVTIVWQPSADAQDDADMTFFFLPTCPHCHDQMVFHDEILLEEYPGLVIDAVDVSTSEGQRRYIEELSALGEPPESIRVPVTIINHTIIRGFDTANTTGQEIIATLEGHHGDVEALQCGTESDCDQPIELSLFGKDFTINPANYSLPVLAIILGGVDGFNPCAMWVLVYLISLVMVLENKKRAWLLVGIFLLASGILYFLFMTVWLNLFLFIGFLRPVQVLIGAFALGAGILNLKKYFTTKGELQCEVGDLESKARTSKKVKELVNSPLTWASLAGMVVLAFMVNSVEFMCSFGIPAVFSEVLAVSTTSSLTHYALIGLYVLMYMIDDIIIFSLAIFAVQSTAGNKYAKYCTLIAGTLLLVLGVLLVFFPGVLASFS